MLFCFYQWQWGADLIFQKKYFETLKKLKTIVNIFVLFIRISCQTKESPLSKQSPLF